MIKVILPEKLLIGQSLKENMAVIFDSHILFFCPVEALDQALIKAGIDRDEVQFLSMADCILAPGFIDVHIHGAAGADIVDGHPDSVERIAKALSKCGVTSFLGATVAYDKARIVQAATAIRHAQANRISQAAPQGAKILGMHLEGPFLSPARAGAHAPQYLIRPDRNFIEGMEDVIRLITYAPELDENNAFLIEILKKFPHIRMSIGHSDASYERAMEAINLGAHSVTHLYNAMRGLHHREPGVVGAALSSDVYVELIADGIHVHEGAFLSALKAKGPDRTILITDAMCASCMAQGHYKLGDLDVYTDASSARLEDGTLAGSVLTMDKAVANVATMPGVDLAQVLYMASTVPADMLGLKHIGRVAPGSAADFTILSKTLKVMCTIIDGEVVFGGPICKS